ncbi:energy transducer TonB [Sulfurospirillum arsenophilum]|uniref:energy transducer TonB n=1 Tax=Sulfurospirillum arsenophilum TaxID=56698 RepID=UPI0005A67922|nr:energy transducer TonB [Sulfurospirillum arsenophilum]
MLARERIKSVNREVSGLCLSFVLHGVVIGFYLLFLHQKPLEIIQGKTVVLEISNIERMAPKPSVPTPPTPVQEVKKVEPVKPIEKIKPLPKPMVKKEVLIPEPTREEVVTASEPVSAVQPNIAHEVSPITPTSTSAEPYEKTDFEIIRDKVLARLIYPSIARRMGWNGVVHVALLIDTDGRLVSATLHQSSGRSMLDDAALEAALKLRGDQLPKPKSLSTVILPIAFKLK